MDILTLAVYPQVRTGVKAVRDAIANYCDIEKRSRAKAEASQKQE